MAKTTVTKEPRRWTGVEGIEAMLVPIASLRQDPANVRRHPASNIAAVRASLEKFGQQKPVVVDKDGVVAAGNGQLIAATELGWTHLAVVRTNLSGDALRAYAIADNRTAELAEWDDAGLANILRSLPELMVPAAGFTAADVQDLLDRVSPPKVEDGDVPAPPDNPTTRPGDIWILGTHRLMCGDSSKPADLDRLLDGAKIHLVNTDPPYNVKVEPRSNNAIAAGNSSFAASKRTHHQELDLARFPGKGKGTTKQMRAKDRPLANDFMTDDAFDVMLDAWFGNIARVLIPGGGFYIWGGYANCANYPPVLKRHGLYFAQAIIWDKMHPVLTRKDFMGAHEWCFYGWKEGAAHRFFGPANIPDLWPIKKVNPQSMVHLTEKPAELASRAMQYSSKRGENVLDLFGGSGSTMAAAEHLERRSFSMELDMPYCDVIVARWEKLTGKKAKRVNAAGEEVGEKKIVTRVKRPAPVPDAEGPVF